MKSYLKALYNLTCKLLQQKAYIRVIKEVTNIINIKLYLYKRSYINLYKIYRVYIL